MVDLFVVILVFAAVNLHDLEQLINAILAKTRWHKLTDWTMLDLNIQVEGLGDGQMDRVSRYHTCLY